jgi:small-conductance mechanosensitive channel
MSETLILGTTYPVFIGVTLICMCGCAVLMGRALASSWRPARHALPYALLLGAADRFLIFALFNGDLHSVTGFIIDTYCILISALLTYRFTLAAQMVRQYPWLYERFLIFSWRERRKPI